MRETERELRLKGLCEEIRGPVKAFCEELRVKLGADVKSVTVVGSSLTEDFVAGRSDINTVVVLNKRILDLLKPLAGLAKSMRKKGISAPVLMTSEYMERSRDVFGIEFLDFQLTHETILGDDPFSELTFSKSEVRLQCERELKATLIRLRQGYIAAGANKKLVRDVLASASGSMVSLLRAMLWLKDKARPQLGERVFSEAAAEFGIIADGFITGRRWRHKKARPAEDEIREVFKSIYEAVEQLAEIVDRLEV